VANAVAYAHAVEEAAGLWPAEGLRRARTLLLELERIYNHLNDLGAVCAGVGLAAGAMAFAALKERAQRVVHDLAGHRFLFGTVAVGRSAVEVGRGSARRARAALADVGRDAACAWRELEHDASLRDRVRGAGHLPPEEAARLGTVGPAARASGAPGDVRDASPRLAYPGFRAAAPADPAGDVAARMEVRAAELADSLAMVDELLSAPVAPAGAAPAGPAAPRGVGRVESPRGRTVCAVELAGGTVRRVHLRTGSYANWPSVARAARGAILPDFPLINKSFELCYACVDR
jgi:Ni,Fe-hydrogenase III large subunit